MDSRTSKRLVVAVVCGGQSAEHEVSVRSARSVLDAMDKNEFDPVVIVIDKRGEWGVVERRTLGSGTDMNAFERHADDTPRLMLSPRRNPPFQVQSAGTPAPMIVDVVFPVLHGPRGEDGAIQGLCRMAGLPCVGSGVLGSAICMDKEVAKRLLDQRRIPVTDFVSVRRAERSTIDLKAIAARLGFPCFVKPASLGSSVGITKVDEYGGFGAAIDLAFTHDDKILIERGVAGREIECAVLGNDRVEVSLPGEIIPDGQFYSYEDKYLRTTTDLVIPAHLDPAVTAEVQRLAKEVYIALECKGMARVDFFVEGSRVLVNEVNTIPGFTSISMYPAMWQATGVTYPSLISRLIRLAIEQFERDESH